MAIVSLWNKYRILVVSSLKNKLLLLLACSSLVVSAVYAETDQKSKIKKDKIYLIGFAQDTMNNDWRIQQVREVEKALSKHKNIRFISTDARAQTAKQILDIKYLVEQGVDLLITSPRDSKALAPVISDTYKKGIPVVLLERGIDSDDYTTLIGPDNLIIGEQAGHALSKLLNGRGKVFMLKGVAAATPTILRTQGFEKALSVYPEMAIVSEKVANYLRGDAIKVTEELLKSNISFDAIYAQSDSMATGARMALMKSGIDPSTIPIIGIDYIKEARDAIRNGEQSVSFTYSTAGREGAEYAVKILNGEAVPKNILIKSIKVDKSNVGKIAPIF